MMIDGCFREVSEGNSFRFKRTDNPWAKDNLLPYEVKFENTGEVRFARILKTVAYIAVDEDANGRPVLNKWNIHRIWWNDAEAE
jgi:hypothetical protein